MTADLSPEAECPVCGTPVRVVGSDEGTQHYEPIELRPIGGLDRKKWTQLLEEEYASKAAALLRDTPEDRERLAMWLHNIVDGDRAMLEGGKA